jgi:hypothetical protein
MQTQERDVWEVILQEERMLTLHRFRVNDEVEVNVESSLNGKQLDLRKTYIFRISVLISCSAPSQHAQTCSSAGCRYSTVSTRMPSALLRARRAASCAYR